MTNKKPQSWHSGCAGILKDRETMAGYNTKAAEQPPAPAKPKAPVKLAKLSPVTLGYIKATKDALLN
jgi:hypothetical protein